MAASVATAAAAEIDAGDVDRLLRVPGRKQVWRCADYDVLGLESEEVTDGRPLLHRVMADGARLRSADHSLDTTRQRCRESLEELPASLRPLEPWRDDQWNVERSAGLRDLIDTVGAQHGGPDGSSPDSPASVGAATSHTAKTSGI